MTEIIQGSPEWHDLRRGKVTASRIADVTARTKSGWGAGRKNYMAELIAERLSGQTEEGFSNAAMQWGNDIEPQARAAYEFFTGQTVVETAFVIHPTIGDTGASPDGLVNDDGLVEIKCPNTATHLDTLLGAAIPEKYVKQMQWQMACTRRSWCDFVSFDPRLPEPMQYFCHRVARDVTVIRSLEEDVTDFLNELRDKEAELRKRFMPEETDELHVLGAG